MTEAGPPDRMTALGAKAARLSAVTALKGWISE